MIDHPASTFRVVEEVPGVINLLTLQRGFVTREAADLFRRRLPRASLRSTRLVEDRPAALAAVTA